MFVGKDGHRVPSSKMSPILAAIAIGDGDVVANLMAKAGLTSREGQQLYKETRQLVRRVQRENSAARKKNGGEAT